MSLLYCGVYVEGLARKSTDRPIATNPSTRAREHPQATNSRIDPRTGAKEREAQAGVICDEIQASPRVATGNAISVHIVVHSRVRRLARVNSGPRPTVAASTSAIVIRSPPSRSREIWTGAPNRGAESHGAAVWATW